MYALCMHNLEYLVQNANKGTLAKRNCQRDLGVSWDISSERQEKSHLLLLVTGVLLIV